MRQLRLVMTLALAGLIVLGSLPTYEDLHGKVETDLEMVSRVCLTMNLWPEAGDLDFFRALDLELKREK